MQILVTPAGTIRCLYAETLDLKVFGQPDILRGSHVEPTADGQWIADLAPVQGPVLGPHPLRSQALAAEAAWLEIHWLTAPCAFG